ncbi:fimbria/pilus periplasmic chaperone [Escherichia coli]|uniref:fimbria/pilus periplasmic chaperone n=1 Tax=Escherichia coli TaxID=562 RepID=UPI0039889EE6
MLTPPVVHVSKGEGQQLKMKQLADALPKDRESLFFLNVLDIPPNSEKFECDFLTNFLMQNRIKCALRPKGIIWTNRKRPFPFRV